MDKKAHWENIYQTKQLNEVSWYQAVPTTSLEIIERLRLPQNAKIIDVGGGDSFLVDKLLELGFTNISVLDISKEAIERAKKRLGSDANKVNWIISDICEFNPTQQYDLWHDRAVFHFLTEDTDINKYKSILNQATKNQAYVSIGTFSENGPLKCSGIPIKQYNEKELVECFKPSFKNIESFNIDHQTPFNTVQNFSFVILQKST
jgi:SAM-dependent methyltransferase